MRIYLASLIKSGFSFTNTGSENEQIPHDIIDQYPWDLESYHALQFDRRWADYMRSINKTIFMDSGAFSMFTRGIEVNLQEYADYLQDNHDVIHVASNLDVIGRDKEAESYANQKVLEDMGANIMPVHHARDSDYWLEKYLDEGYDYIFLGGMVPETGKYLRLWLDRIWENHLVNEDGTAKVKVHGFGLTTLDLINRYPWYSVDSTSWVMASRFGQIFLDLEHRDLKLTFSDQSPRMRDLGMHYDTLDPVTRATVDRRITDLGFDPQLLRTHFGWRDAFNIQFFKRVMDRPDPKFRRREETLF
jgi:hypothetical protein